MGFRYRRLKIFKKAKEIHQKIVKVSKNFPKDFRYLKDQMCRASLSVVLNIAEGSGKVSKKEFGRYIGNSLGSLNELVACCEIAKDENLLKRKDFKEIEADCEVLKNQLGKFLKTLKTER